MKLRNELVHEYALDAGRRLHRMTQAYDAIPPLLLDAAARVDRLIEERKLLEMPA